MKSIDKINKKFGKLTVKKIIKYTNKGQAIFECICDCGNTKIVKNYHLGTNTNSCGCLRTQNFFAGYKDISGNWWNKLIKRAKKLNYQFDLTIEYIWDLYIKQNRRCALSNLEITFCKNHNHTAIFNVSIDRIDSTKGYTKNNIQLVHKTINAMKTFLPELEFITLCGLVYQTKIKNQNFKPTTNFTKIFKKTNRSRK